MGPEMMPEQLGEWLADVAYRVRCPIDFVAAAAVLMIGAVCAGRVRIRPGGMAGQVAGGQPILEEGSRRSPTGGGTGCQRDGGRRK